MTGLTFSLTSQTQCSLLFTPKFSKRSIAVVSCKCHTFFQKHPFFQIVFYISDNCVDSLVALFVNLINFNWKPPFLSPKYWIIIGNNFSSLWLLPFVATPKCAISFQDFQKSINKILRKYASNSFFCLCAATTKLLRYIRIRENLF